jgi:hypothetical protein
VRKERERERDARFDTHRERCVIATQSTVNARPGGKMLFFALDFFSSYEYSFFGRTNLTKRII